MSESDGGYDLKPQQPKPPAAEPAGTSAEGGQATTGATPRPKPGEPGFVPPVPIIEKADPVVDYQGNAPDPDVEQHRGMAVLGYVCFLIPLLAAPKSPYARFHANQGLLTFIFWGAAIVGNVVLALMRGLLAYIDWSKLEILHGLMSCGVVLLQFGLIICAIGLTLFGMIQAANGEKNGLPILGKITLIK